MKHTPQVLEICAGGGGQALGLERAGFGCAAAVEIDPDACATLRSNRPHWNVIQRDIRELSGNDFRGIDLLAGGVPCPPFSIAGKQLGKNDERDLFPEALRLVEESQPTAVMLENVRGFLAPRFADYRSELREHFRKLGYTADWRLLDAVDFGVPQFRPRFVLVALRDRFADGLIWPQPTKSRAAVGETLLDLMASNGWCGATQWAAKANAPGPTVVGGSKKHGGPDLGPTRARAAWRALGVDGLGIANAPPPHDAPADLHPKLTVQMVARIQGFPDDWRFAGKKTTSYRQVGNAFPPQVAEAVARSVWLALTMRIPRSRTLTLTSEPTRLPRSKRKAA